MIRGQRSEVRNQKKLALWLLIAACWLPMFAWAANAAPLFDAQLVDAQDKPATLAIFRGKPLIVNFWARWCSPCRDEMPEIKLIDSQYRGRGLTVIGIAIEENSANARDFLKAYEIDYPNFFAGSRGTELLKTLGNDKAGLPYTVFIDRQGKLIGHKLGRISRGELEAAANALLQ